MYDSVSVGPLFVCEDDEFAREFASPEFGRDSTDVFDIEDGRHVYDQGSWYSANKQIIQADTVFNSSDSMKRGVGREE
jgi:hypothetical protein